MHNKILIGNFMNDKIQCETVNFDTPNHVITVLVYFWFVNDLLLNNCTVWECSLQLCQ